MSRGVLSGVTPDGREHGLERFTYPAGGEATLWLAPAGSTATVEVDGDGSAADIVELRWSELSAQVPSVRAIVLLDGPGSGDPAADFALVHEVAETVARFATDRSRTETGPIDVLVFRPEIAPDAAPAVSPGVEPASPSDVEPASLPVPTPTSTGAEFRFRHRGGPRVHVSLTLPTADLSDTPGGD